MEATYTTHLYLQHNYVVVIYTHFQTCCYMYCTTGSGKILCSQFPSLITTKATLALTTTIISLMHDQTCWFARERNLSLIPGEPVEFVYIKSKDPADNHQWITRIVRGHKHTADNLHNHPLHGNVQITAKVGSDIRHAVIENPQLKTQDIVTGMYPKAAMTSCYFQCTRISNVYTQVLGWTTCLEQLV